MVRSGAGCTYAHRFAFALAFAFAYFSYSGSEIRDPRSEVRGQLGAIKKQIRQVARNKPDRQNPLAGGPLAADDME
jgi:hypothetical protein